MYMYLKNALLSHFRLFNNGNNVTDIGNGYLGMGVFDLGEGYLGMLGKSEKISFEIIIFPPKK